MGRIDRFITKWGNVLIVSVVFIFILELLFNMLLHQLYLSMTWYSQGVVSVVYLATIFLLYMATQTYHDPTLLAFEAERRRDIRRRNIIYVTIMLCVYSLILVANYSVKFNTMEKERLRTIDPIHVSDTTYIN